MWCLVLAIAMVSMATDAREIMSKRSTYVDVDAYNFGNYFKQFGGTLAHILGEEYNKTKSQAEALKADMTSCKSLMSAKQDICKACAKNKCKPGIDDMIVYYLEEAASPFVDFGNLIGDWKGWDDMSDWFEGAGKDFVNWGGWDDMGDFFENIGKGFVNWSGWNDMGDWFENFGKDFVNFFEDDVGGFFSDIGSGIGDIFGRRKRSLMLSRQATGEQLVHLYRALSKVYSREISSEVRACMEKCDSCKPFLSDTETMINTICGPELLQLNATYFNAITKIQLVYNLLKNEKEPILKSLKFDPTSYSPALISGDFQSMGYSKSKLLAMFANGFRDFEPTQGYMMMKVPTSAALAAKEYWEEV